MEATREREEDRAGRVIDMSSIVDAVRTNEEDEGGLEDLHILKMEIECTRRVQPILVSKKDPAVCHKLLNGDMDPRGNVRRALCLITTIDVKKRGPLWLFDWYSCMTSSTVGGVEVLNRLMRGFLTHLLIPFAMNATQEGTTMTLDGLAPLIFFAPHLDLALETENALKDLIVSGILHVTWSQTFFWINHFICQRPSTSILQAYVRYALCGCPCSDACVDIMIKNGMIQSLQSGEMLRLLVDAWLWKKIRSALALLVGAMRSSTYVAVKVHDYLTHRERRDVESGVAAVLVCAIIRAMPYAHIRWDLFDTTDVIAWDKVRNMMKHRTSNTVFGRSHTRNATPWVVEDAPTASTILPSSS